MSCHGDAKSLSFTDLTYDTRFDARCFQIREGEAKLHHVTHDMLCASCSASYLYQSSQTMVWERPRTTYGKMFKCLRLTYLHRKAYNMSEIQCVVQGLFGELRAAIEELLLPGAKAE